MSTEIEVYDPGVIVVRPNYSAWLDDWKADLTARVAALELSHDTAAAYYRGASRFFDWLADRNPEPDIIRAWKAEELKSAKPASVNAWLAGLKSFFAWAAEKSRIPFDPAQVVKSAKRHGTKSRHSRKPLTDTEVLRVLEQPDRTTPEGSRDYAIIALMLYAGARTVEIHRANVDDLDTQGGRMVLRVQGKGRTETDEILVLAKQSEKALRDWLAQRGTEPGALFTSFSDRNSGGHLSRSAIRGLVKRYYKAAGVTGRHKTTHSLRHTAISKAIQRGAGLEKVQGMSRHASLATLGIYAHEADRIENPAEDFIEYGE